jgi:hypothetical protein
VRISGRTQIGLFDQSTIDNLGSGRSEMTERRDNAAPAPETEAQTPVTGIDFNEIRTGEDTRQRGWFWHWNELHTEYGPLLQHSGIGLITSYIVWTDRREHSPYRGYAFPSLQTQASFSGSDRAELMTINRILVALDLIEIRKEMVQRIDEKGHKWRVPHNLYRVKDRSGDPHLSSKDVMRVLEIAASRTDVYRHIRHVLTPGFQPISRSNIWHQILEEVRTLPLWQELAAKAAAEEARYSERSKAGHRSRRSTDAGAEGDVEAGTKTTQREAALDLIGDVWIPGESDLPVTVDMPEGQECATEPVVTVVGGSNHGLRTSVAGSSEGLANIGPGSVAPSSTGQVSSVAQSNAKQYVFEPTTTKESGTKSGEKEAVTRNSGSVTEVVTSRGPALSQVAGGPNGDIPSGHGPERAAALIAFAEANGRVASGAEERLLGQIITQVPGVAGWDWIRAAIYEAVDAGSVFVAPKRVREIVRRWAVDGYPGDPGAVGEMEPVASAPSGESGIGQEPRGGGNRAGDPDQDQVSRRSNGEPFWIAEAGLASGQLWQAVLELVTGQALIRRNDVRDYLESARLIDRPGARTFQLEVRDELSRKRIERFWLADLEETLGQLLGGRGWQIELIAAVGVEVAAGA